MQGLGLLGLKFCVHVFPLVFGEVGVGHYQRADSILHLHATSDIHKPSLLQSCIQFISGQEVTIFHSAVHTGKAVLTTSNFAKLITFLNIIKEKPEINKHTLWLKNTKDTLVKIKLLSKRYFMISTFEYHSIKYTVGQ